ncbi:kinase-like domain-containing protein, partial [Lineolata rhizophorae]
MNRRPVASARGAAQQSPREHTQQPSRGGGGGTPSSRTHQSPQHSRSATAVGSTPVGTNLPREESTIINRLVITDPQEDLARERARQAEARPGAPAATDVTPVTGLGLVGSEGVEDGGRGGIGRTRQDMARAGGDSRSARKETRFGDYILGQTLGEGEFGKVKMGWKKDGGVQVAIKLIRRETLGSNPSRLPKIYREINILRELQHPNIVRLHEMVETERHIGIILEYASGGELFDYILNHRYLKDNAARRLFAQLVSGVGYLHKKGIVHRDLKLENLLLDRNRNIIITDFGFANTFDPNDELSDEIEYNLNNRDFVKKMNLEAIGKDGHRRGDLMQTSCGSPCYAAPELVVSDSLYTGRKVDVWSCGVILVSSIPCEVLQEIYAMLAGYLPFDDDPANPEGDNINLLYKYIVSTPLTFPDYVTPHARDLLKRILVPDPRKRADLFEVARHSWLSEYAHVVALITSSTTTERDIANTTV